MISLKRFCEWFEGELALGVPVVAGPEIPKMPDRVVVITSTSGPGFLTEEAALDRPILQARVRGAQGNRWDAEELAQAVDQAVLRLHLEARFPVHLDDQLLSNLTRSGGPPAMLGNGPDDGNRYEYVCNYLTWMSTAGVGVTSG